MQVTQLNPLEHQDNTQEQSSLVQYHVPFFPMDPLKYFLGSCTWIIKLSFLLSSSFSSDKSDVGYWVWGLIHNYVLANQNLRLTTAWDMRILKEHTRIDIVQCCIM